MIRELRDEHFLLCESLYLKAWDRVFKVEEYALAIQSEIGYGSICFDSRGYARAFAIYTVTPKLTSIGHFAATVPDFIEELLRPIITRCETPIQLCVPDQIYDQAGTIQALTELGFRGSGIIEDEVEGDLVKFRRVP